MTKRDDILRAGEVLFARRGFHAVPIDNVIREAGVSPRTLYAHFPSKEALAVGVLTARNGRFLTSLADAVDEPGGLEALFDRLEAWLRAAPPNGCLFLRAYGEFKSGPIDECVAAYRKGLRAVARRFSPPCANADAFADELLLLIEGATSLAASLGAKPAVDAARKAAQRMIP
ncbi:MAG: TetR/AcrR family transcriptional regulator [Parvularculaceae bacterium]